MGQADIMYIDYYYRHRHHNVKYNMHFHKEKDHQCNHHHHHHHHTVQVTKCTAIQCMHQCCKERLPVQPPLVPPLPLPCTKQCKLQYVYPGYAPAHATTPPLHRVTTTSASSYIFALVAGRINTTMQCKF